jgi:4-hydroxybenzoate polyprenyltransferase
MGSRQLAAVSAPADPTGWQRFWVYQRERFPLAAHGPLIACFSFCAISYSAQLRGSTISLPGFLVAFASCLFSFLHLRIADEFKDFEDDSRYRPYRAVPRGLVQLRELGWIWVITGALQVLLALWLSPALVVLLLITWTYLGLMTREFFVREWLKARPVTYMWTHMLIMPLIDLYATACDWIPAGQSLPSGLFWFLVVSFFNGVTLELGRKIRAPEDEETGVETYSFLWGRQRAVAVWLVAMLLTAVFALAATARIDFLKPSIVIFSLVLSLSFLQAWAFLADPTSRSGKRFEMLSGIWTMTLYLTIGALPLATAWFMERVS